jgi:diaminopimelate epimerase
MIQENEAQFPDELKVLKYQALGNSYLVVDPRDNQQLAGCGVKRADGHTVPSTNLVTWLCDQSRGIGSNGLLFGPVKMTGSKNFGLCIINSDGTYAGFSGNGIRIFARYLVDAGYVRKGTSIGVQTLVDESVDIPRVAAVNIGAKAPWLIDVTIPYPPRFGPVAIGANAGSISPLAEDGLGLSFTVDALASLGERLTKRAWYDSTFVDIGNPHCSTFVQEAAFLPTRQQLLSCDDALRAISFRDPGIHVAPIFAHGANLQWVSVLARGTINLVIYERGEGPTDASGSSACAAACAAFARGMVDAAVEVNMPGGSLIVRIVTEANNIASVTLSGSATRILTARVDGSAR